MRASQMGFGALLAATLAAGSMLVSVTPASAVIYCKTVGYPIGCIARPAAVVVRPAPVVVHTGPVVYCKRVGYPKGCVVR